MTFETTIAKNTRSFQIGDAIHTVPGGTVKFNFVIRGVPFGGAWPENATNLQIPTFITMTEFPTQVKWKFAIQQQTTQNK